MKVACLVFACCCLAEMNFALHLDVQQPPDEQSTYSGYAIDGADEPVADVAKTGSHEAPPTVQNADVHAFTAEMATSRVINKDLTVVFGNVISNYGELYFNESGQFACVNQDIYVFLWSTVNMLGNNIRNSLKLRMGNQYVKYGPNSNLPDSARSGCSSMLSVAKCRTDTPTAVTVVTDSIDAMFNAPYTSFSGFRLAREANAVAFTAELSADRNVFPDQRIVFDRVLQNFGHGYNSLHGYFRCPDYGVYAFFVSTLTHVSTMRWSVSTLMMDGQPVMHGPVTYGTEAGKESGSSSIMATMECQQGLDVHVDAQNAYTFTYNSYGAELTSFSGFRLSTSNTSDTVSAFTAVLSTNHTFLLPLNRSRNLIFDDVVTDVGGDYDRSTGVFTCPDDAVYFFSWSATSNIGGGDLELSVDGEALKANALTVQTSAVSTGTSGTSTMGVVAACRPASQVSVRANATTPAGTIFIAQYTSFSGFRIPDMT